MKPRRICAIASDPSRDIELRKSAVRTLTDLKDAESAQLLIHILNETVDPDFQVVILHAIGSLGKPAILPALHEFEMRHSEEVLRETVEEAREAILNQGKPEKE